MTTQYTTILKLALPVQGELSGTWGDVVNDNITSMVEEAVAGRKVINTWTANSHTLTSADGTTSEARAAILTLTDTGTALSGAGTVVCPAASKIYIVENSTAQVITIKTSGGTGIAVPVGKNMVVFCDGTNVEEGISNIASLSIGGDGATVTGIKDEDNMASNSATKLATQQSIKAYVDSQVGANNELSEVLTNGNTTGGTDISVSTGDDITFADSSKAIFGAGSDLQIYHDGTDSIINESTAGNLLVQGATIKLQTANGAKDYLVASPSAEVTLYHDNAAKLATTSTGIDVTGTVTASSASDALVRVSDSTNANQRLDLTHNAGVASIISGNNGAFGTLKLQAYNGTDTIDRFRISSNGDINLGYEDTGTTAKLQWIASDENLEFADNSKAVFGAGSDLQIYHDGSKSIIADTGTGPLSIQGENTIVLEETDGTNYATFTKDAAVTLYYAGAAKIDTTSTGIDVTGTVTADGLTVDGTAVITTADNLTQLTLKSTDTDASVGPRFDMLRDSASPAANDAIGAFRFMGKDSAGNSVSYVNIQAIIGDPTDASEDGILKLETRVNSALKERITMNSTELVINEESADLDFRAESNLNAYKFFLDAGNDRIIFGSGTSVSVGGSGAEFQINGTTGNSSAQSITRFGNDANSPILKFGKSRNGTIGSNTIVQSGDNLGIIQFCGDDGTNLGSKAADILSEVDGTPGENDMPGRIVFRTTADGADSTTERMRITKEGLVGIGIASPNEPLHVFHATRNVLVNIESGDSGAYISFKDDDTTDTDTVFIGAVDNDLKLYAGGSTDRLAIIGSNGTIQTRTAGSNNVRLGLDAGGNIGGSADFNTLIGDSAGAAITTGDANVAVGFEALATEDGHGRNVAIGYRALKTLNAGTNGNNTVVGYGAGVLMTTATQNTFLGSLVGDEITTGGANVALGYGALSAETSSSRNVAVGALTLQAQNGTAGQTYNTAVGYNAGNDITTGARNTCVGGLSGDAMTTGTNNTFIGYNTGGTGVVTGADNTALGISAGASLTSGTNNVLIGHDAGVSGSPGGNINNESNEIVIGDDAITQAHIQVDWTVASDQRDKTDFVDLDLGLDFVKALEPVTYYWDKRSKYGDKYTTDEEGDLVLNEDYDLDDFTPDGTHKEDWMDIGFKAQAVQALEEAAGYTTAAKKNLTVSTTADGKQMGLQYSKFVPILVKAIQDQDAIITALTARIEALES